VAAEKMGFDGIFVPDHFHPWTVAEGTPFAWTLLASVAERTRRIPVGTAVTSPIIRYNPAIVAQAFATLGATYEGRIFLGVGTGEALNELPTTGIWPKGGERLGRLREAIKVIRMLWTGDHRSHWGKYYTLDEAKLYTIPRRRVPIYVSGFGPKAAELAGELGDGWITGPLPPGYINDVLLPAYMSGVQKSGRNQFGMERIVEVLISYDEDYDKAVESCRQIAGAMVPEVMQGNVHDPRKIKKFADALDHKSIGDLMPVYDKPDGVISRLEDLSKLGFTWIEIGSLSPDNDKFLRVMGEKVLPSLRG
jgi:coenzyme F420-dependent glucose-6-phosphate dehydrogenase